MDASNHPSNRSIYADVQLYYNGAAADVFSGGTLRALFDQVDWRIKWASGWQIRKVVVCCGMNRVKLIEGSRILAISLSFVANKFGTVYVYLVPSFRSKPLQFYSPNLLSALHPVPLLPYHKHFPKNQKLNPPNPHSHLPQTHAHLIPNSPIAQ